MISMTMEAKSKKKKTTVRVGRYVVIGVTITLFNFVVYTILAQVMQNNGLLWLDSIISYFLATILAYILHSRITWRERRPGKRGMIAFFAWNFFNALVTSPLLTLLFGLWKPVYELAYNIAAAMHLPFTYDFVESTGIFGFMTVVVMVLNYLCYDKVVFGVERARGDGPGKGGASKIEETKIRRLGKAGNSGIEKEDAMVNRIGKEKVGDSGAGKVKRRKGDS